MGKLVNFHFGGCNNRNATYPARLSTFREDLHPRQHPQPTTPKPTTHHHHETPFAILNKTRQNTLHHTTLFKSATAYTSILKSILFAHLSYSNALCIILCEISRTCNRYGFSYIRCFSIY